MAVVLSETQDFVTTITLNRPERRNAANPELNAALEAALKTASDDPMCRCVILTGADPAFCSGDDVREIFVARQGQAAPEQPRIRFRPNPAGQAALNCEKPLIAAVNGAAVGWGMELALYADIRIVSERAVFAELFVKRGLVCDVGGFHILPRLVGPEKAAELLYTGDLIDAAEALRIGLVGQVAPHEDLMPRARALAARIAANPPLALRHMKNGLRRWTYGDPDQVGAWAIGVISGLMQTADHREGVASFLEKRAPNFTGQ